MPHRCAFGCKDTGNVMHSLPNPGKFPERFKAWVNLVGYNLETLTDNDIFKKKRICDIHFTDEHRNRFKRLNALAMPTLYLPGESDGITATTGQSEANLSFSHPTTSTSFPSTSTPGECHGITATTGQSEANLSFSHPTTSTSLPSTSTPGDSFSVTATTQQFEAFSVAHSSINTCLLATSTSDKSHCTAATNSVTMEHNYSMMSRQTRLFKDARESIGALYSCIKMRPLQKKMKYLQNEIGRLRKKGQSFQARLANAEKLSNKSAFQLVTKNMTKPAQLFVLMQLQSSKKSKGRRFSIEEKVMSLSLFKKSPKCRLLCKYFALPSAKAMKRLLSQIKLVPGINPIIFEKIKKTLAEKDVPDRLCSLMFDEMSLTKARKEGSSRRMSSNNRHDFIN